VFVEVMRDVVLRLSPLYDVDATDMIDAVRGRPILDGVRGLPPRDKRSIAEVISRVSQLAERHPEIVELDINPLVALANGVVAVDARVMVRAAT
jgi:acetyltransferase